MTGSEHIHPNLSGLRTRREILEVLWRQGLSGTLLLEEHTHLIDSHLITKFSKCSDAQDGMALIAVGGYGRRELFPFSDIDLLLLHTPKTTNRLHNVAEAIFYPLWDAGLEVGHSVRTPKTCITDAENDFFFQVSLLDSRLLTGSKTLYNQLQAQFHKNFIQGKRTTFLEQMVFHRNERHRRFGKHSYLLEPQIKESRGGMRDVQALLWTAKVIFGLKDLEDIKEAGLLTKNEHLNFKEAWEHLIKIRNRLHYISSRKNDQLFFEHQADIAKAFRYQNTRGIQGVEHFMRNVYNNLQTIAITTDLFFEHVDEVLNKSSVHHPEEDINQIDAGVISSKGRIRLSNKISSNDSPELLLRIFAQCAKTGQPIHHQTRKQITANLDIIDDAFRTSTSAASIFIDTLSQEQAPLALEFMLECGLLNAFLPEFNHLKSLAQHDVYHVYTVDHHLIQTVAVLHQLKGKHPNTFNLISAPHILFLAGLLHDIGKGYGEDHAAKGHQLSRTTGNRLNLSAHDQSLLEFLIANHLFLTDTALRRDLEDPIFIERCSQTIENTEKLAMLFLLSIADAMATGPTVWNDWKEALLLDLYLKISLLLDQKDSGESTLNTGIEWIRESVNKQFPKQCPIELSNLPDDYLLNFTPEEITDHILQSQTLTDNNLIVSAQDKKTSWSLLIITKDRPGLLTKICGVIALNNLEMLASQIFTWPNGIAIDSIDVRPIHENTHANHDWSLLKNDLHRAINFRLGLEYRLSRKQIPSSKKMSPAIKLPPKVILDNSTSERYTIIEVHTENRTGIMYNITRILTEFQINIYRAKISTRSDLVVDVFYVLDFYRKKITEKSFMEEIKQSLTYAASE